MSTPTPTKVFITAHHVDPLEVTRFSDKHRSYLPGAHHAEGITIDGDKPDTIVERLYRNRADLPPLGSVDTWPIRAEAEEQRSVTLTVEPA